MIQTKDMSYKLTIRRAVESDVKDIASITREAFGRYVEDAGIKKDIEALNETYDDILNDIKSIHVFIAFADETPAGVIRVRVENDDSAYIQRFAVIVARQKNGIGKALINYADEFMRSIGVKKSKLYTAAAHTELVCFYYRMGYHIDSTSKDKGYTRALMVKKL